MKLAQIYATFVNNYVEKNRNELFKYMLKNDVKKDKLIKDYDKLLLNSYLYIEELLDDEKENE